MTLYTIIIGVSKIVQKSNVLTPFLSRSNNSFIKLVLLQGEQTLLTPSTKNPKQANFENLVKESRLEKDTMVTAFILARLDCWKVPFSKFLETLQLLFTFSHNTIN